MMNTLSRKSIKELSDYFGIDFLDKPTFQETKGKKKDCDLYVADIHAPFHHRELVAKTIVDNRDCDEVWVLGDTFDFYSRSFFRKRYDISFAWEFAEGYKILRHLAKTFRRVNVMITNHDQRSAKYIYDNVPKELLPFCRVNIVEELIELMPNVHIRKQKICQGKREIEYLYQNKNVIYSHVEDSSSAISLTAQKVEQQIRKWEKFYGLTEYDSIIQAHNHQSGKVRLGNKFLYQIPCLIDISQLAFDYVFSGKLNGNPPALGYIRAYKTNGKFDPYRSHITDY